MAGIPLNGKVVDLDQLQAELATAGVAVAALGTDGTDLFTYNAAGRPADLPQAAAAILAAHTPGSALHDQLVSRLQTLVGVAFTDLTNPQLLLLIGGLLYKAGGLNRQGQIRPLNQWLV